MTEICGVITTQGEVRGVISGSCVTENQGNAPIYRGEYIVTPTAREQTLQTKGKLLEKDITVEKIAFSETSNESGTTVTIGG